MDAHPHGRGVVAGVGSAGSLAVAAGCALVIAAGSVSFEDWPSADVPGHPAEQVTLVVPPAPVDEVAVGSGPKVAPAQAASPASPRTRRRAAADRERPPGTPRPSGTQGLGSPQAPPAPPAQSSPPAPAPPPAAEPPRPLRDTVAAVGGLTTDTGATLGGVVGEVDPTLGEAVTDVTAGVGGVVQELAEPLP